MIDFRDSFREPSVACQRWSYVGKNRIRSVPVKAPPTTGYGRLSRAFIGVASKQIALPTEGQEWLTMVRQSGKRRRVLLGILLGLLNFALIVFCWL